MSIGGEAWFFDSFWRGNSERGWRWRFLFDGVWSQVFRVVEASIFVVFGSHEVAVGALVERAFLSEMSKVVALGAEGFSSMFCWGIFKGYKERECVKLVEGM